MNGIESIHLVKGLDPVADAFAATVYSDAVNLKEYDHAAFILFKGVGTTGTSTITVEASDDASGSNVAAVAFRYRAITTGDTEGAVTAATTAGFTTTAGSSQLYAIEVRAQEIASSGYSYVRVKCVESVDSPVLGGILIILDGARYAQALKNTVIT